MSKAISSHTITAGRIGSPEISPQTVDVEPTYFVSFDEDRQIVYINDNPTFPSIVEMRSFINTVRSFRDAETLPGSCVYRLTLAQLQAMGDAARERKEEYLESLTESPTTRQEAPGEARQDCNERFVPYRSQAPYEACEPHDDECHNCPIVDECEAGSLVECAFYDGPHPGIDPKSLERAGTYSPRED